MSDFRPDLLPSCTEQLAKALRQRQRQRPLPLQREYRFASHKFDLDPGSPQLVRG